VYDRQDVGTKGTSYFVTGARLLVEACPLNYHPAHLNASVDMYDLYRKEGAVLDLCVEYGELGLIPCFVSLWEVFVVGV